MSRWQFVEGQEHHPLYRLNLCDDVVMYVRCLCPRDRDPAKEALLPLPSITVSIYEDKSCVFRKVVANDLPRDFVFNICDYETQLAEIGIGYFTKLDDELRRICAQRDDYWDFIQKLSASRE
jgi:hypothetical protein